MELENIIKGIKEKGLYDFVAQNYYELSKEDLKEIILNLDYAIYKIGDLWDNGSKEIHTDVTNRMLEDLKERNM